MRPASNLCAPIKLFDDAVKSAWTILRQSAKEFSADSSMTLSAATAYYAVFSIAPLLVLVAGLASLVFGQQHVQDEIGRQLQSFVAPKPRTSFSR